jgi:hypothetical protein
VKREEVSVFSISIDCHPKLFITSMKWCPNYSTASGTEDYLPGFVTAKAYFPEPVVTET